MPLEIIRSANFIELLRCQSKHRDIYLDDLSDFTVHYARSRLESAIFLPLHPGRRQ